jgi:hypothetical protein
MPEVASDHYIRQQALGTSVHLEVPGVVAELPGVPAELAVAS